MKLTKTVSLLAAVLLLVLSLTACQFGTLPSAGTAATPAEDTQDPTMVYLPDTAAPVQGESTDTPDDDAQRLAAYREALSSFYSTGRFPDGTDSGYSADFGEITGNRFAICDVDGDGADELILQFVTAPVAGQLEIVYRYDSASSTLVSELSEYPSLSYGANGSVTALFSHNQGLSGGDFWPYHRYVFDAAAQSYTLEATVDAWSRAVSDTDFDGNPYPNDIDREGAGIVYLVTENGSTNTLSKSDYESWLMSHPSGAAILVPYTELTESAIAAIDETAVNEISLSVFADSAEGLAALLDNINTRVEVGTAGSSLKATYAAGQLLDWCAATKLSADDVRAATLAWMVNLGNDVQIAFAEKLALVNAACSSLRTDKGADLMSEAGYPSAAYPWTTLSPETLSSIMEAVGVE